MSKINACYNCKLEKVCRSNEKFDEFRDYFNEFTGKGYSLNECKAAIASLCGFYVSC